MGTTKWLVAVVVAANLGGCKTDPLANGRESWAHTKQTCRQYHYAIGATSFNGTKWTTTVEITDDRPTARTHVQEKVFGAGAPAVTSVCTESGADVGLRCSGAPPRTMEQLYDECARDVVSQDHYQVGTDDRGVLVECWYRTGMGCVDDCTYSLGVSDFGCAPLDVPDGGAPDATAMPDAQADAQPFDAAMRDAPGDLAPDSGSFACAGMTCGSGQYCFLSRGGADASPLVSTCMDVPAACATDVTCACLTSVVPACATTWGCRDHGPRTVGCSEGV